MNVPQASDSPPIAICCEPADSADSERHANGASPSAVIIGAGPAGLTLAWELQQAGWNSQIIERDSQPGGLAKTVFFKGYGFDIGGHRFFTKIKRVQKLWVEILGEDMIKVRRLSRIYYRGHYFLYPLKPWNAFTGLGSWNCLRIVASYLHSQMFPHPKEDFFDQYIINRFGRRLYEIFFRTYTEKVWGIPCSEIRADWAAQRIKGLCLKQAVLNAFGHSQTGVKSLIEEFDYPRLGPGMLWENLATKIAESGGQINLNQDVKSICHANGRITHLLYGSTDSTDKDQVAGGQYFFSTMPLRTLLCRLHPPPPQEVTQAAQSLRYRDFITVNLIIRRENLFPDNWIYVHSPDVQVGRIQNLGNWSSALVPQKGFSSLSMEYFCFENDDLWAKTDDQILKLAKQELQKLGLAQISEVDEGFVLRVKKAYPMYDADFHDHLDVIHQYLGQFDNLHVLGRNGLHKYNNQDHSMLTAMLTAENLLHSASHDIWAINSDSEYQETMIEAKAAV